jgi:hypothetical protein
VWQIPEIPVYTIAAVCAAVMVAVVAFKAGTVAVDTSMDKRLAEQANKVAKIAESLSGPASEATVEVQVPSDTVLRVLNGQVVYQGRSTRGSINTTTTCNLVLPGGQTYILRLRYQGAGVSCEVV